MTRKHWILAAAAVLIMALVCLSAAFADDPVKVTMDLSANQFAGPKTIDIKISVTNTGSEVMPGPVTLYYPSGKQVEEFGSPTLGVGEGKEWSGTWTVTEDELQSGKITFKIKYSINNENGELVNKTKNFSKKISYAGAEPQLLIERTARPSVASNGQQVSVTYKFVNNGGVDVTDIVIKEHSSVSSKSGTIASIPAGGQDSYTFTVTMGKKDITSSAVITYKAGGKTYSDKKDEAVIKNGVVPITATLSGDKKGGAKGETLHLTLKIKNAGKSDITDITVTDADLGEVFTGEAVPAGTTATLEKDVVMNETAIIQLAVKGKDADGQTVETATGPVQWTVLDPAKQAVLNVTAEADRDTVFDIPGKVRFTVTVKNDGPVEVSKIPVKAAGTTLYTFASIPAGEERSFTRDVDISMPGQFRFDAVYTDELGQAQTFESNVIPIGLASVTPVPTNAPIITPEPPRYEDIPTDDEDILPDWMKTVQKIADSLKWVLLGLTAALLLLLVIAIIKRIAAKVHSAGAMDHLESVNHRDYGAMPKRGKRSEVSDREDRMAAAEEKETGEGTAQDGSLVSEALRRLYTEDKQQDVGDTAETRTEETTVGNAAENANADTNEDAGAGAAENVTGNTPENTNTPENITDKTDNAAGTATAENVPETGEKAPETADKTEKTEKTDETAGTGDLNRRIDSEIQSAATYRRSKKKRASSTEQK